MMDATRPQLRSLSDSEPSPDEPQPAKFIIDAPSTQGARRVAIPHMRSMSAMQNASSFYLEEDQEDRDDGEDSDDAFYRNIAREQADRETMKELVKFFRNTGPPVAKVEAPESSCFGKTGQPETRRWSSVRRSLRGSKGKYERPVSLPMRDASKQKTTAAGHSYMAIAIPPALGVTRRASLQSPITTLAPYEPTPFHRPQPEWPVRTSSRAITQTPTSQDGRPKTETPVIPDRSSHGSDVAALVSRGSSKKDPNSFKLSIRVNTAEHGVRSFMRLVDEWLDDQTDGDSSSQSRSTKSPKHSSHKSKHSVMRAPMPVTEEVTEEDGETASAATKPQRQSSSASPSASPSDVPNFTITNPFTPPAMHTEEPQFPNISPPGRQSQGFERRSTDVSPKSSPRLGNSSLSTVPNQTGESRRDSGRSSLKQRKKPSSITVKSTLEVPETNILPESPGFPMLLAKMAFPSPPESIRSHSTNNSVSFSSPGRPLTTPPGRSGSTRSPTSSNLDELVMRTTRPALRQSKSDGATLSYAHHGSTSPVGHESLGIEMGDPSSSSQGSVRPRSHDASTSPQNNETNRQDAPAGSVSMGASDQRFSMESADLHDGESQRESTVSTVESTARSTSTGVNRDSIKSDNTSVASGATETNPLEQTTSQQQQQDAASTTSSRPPTLNGESIYSQESTPSSRPLSMQSFSSTATSATATSLAERRMARRARVREKLHRDLETSKANAHAVLRSAAGEIDYCDSPVLGRLPQTFPGSLRFHHKTASEASSRLAQESMTSGSKPASTPRRSSVHDITQLIPETVQETSTPVTPNDPESPAAEAASDEPAQEPATTKTEDVPARSLAPSLAISPIMVVANIEAVKPSYKSLRPLSLLTTTSSPPSVSSRSTMRPDGFQVRKRPLPIRVSTNSLELASKTATSLMSKRSSFSHAPSQPMHSEPTSSLSMSSRHSLSRLPPKDRRSSTASRDDEHEWLSAHQRQTAREWRLTALRERMRREAGEDGTTPESVASRFTDMSAPEEETGEDEDVDDDLSDSEKQRRLREKHCRNTLRALNANARANDKHRRATAAAAHRKPMRRIRAGDDHTPPLASPETGYELDTPSPYAYARTDGEQRLLRAIVPLLESMDATLKEMQRDHVTRELSMKFIDSALALATPIMSGRRGMSPRSAASPRRSAVSPHYH